MNDYKEEISFLDTSEKEERKLLMSKWRECSKEKDRLYQQWLKITDLERSRREGVEVTWKNTNGVFEDATAITKESNKKRRKIPPPQQKKMNATMGRLLT